MTLRWAAPNSSRICAWASSLDQFGLVVQTAPAVIGGEIDHIAFAQIIGGDDFRDKLAAHAASLCWA